MKKNVLAVCLLSAGIGCRASDSPPPDAGISRDLARHRARTLADVRYELTLEIPDAVDEPIRGRELVHVVRGAGAGPLVLDFEGSAEEVLAVNVVTGDRPERSSLSTGYRVENGHLVIPEDALQDGENAVEVEFLAGDGSLNRRESFLYTLFVPDRAHHAFPCFDQPDLKSRFLLTLVTPADWQAVAVAGLVGREDEDGRARWSFTETAPLPTYLLAFAAGEFQVETAERGGRTMSFYHRETDAEKVARNRDTLFDLHAASLAWLEDYTTIDYPFAKLDFVLVPGFQYGGMEHPEAIFYRDASLLLDESATQSDLLGRASLIAHEVAHMWFGDLVTMPWFDDVWMKEVFANFMAAKIVHPSFPDVDHELRFVLRHFPAAYEVDRSRGANPIRQELDNLNEAGTLYGAVIYQKAPIVMRHLELLMGDDALREGLREYLDRHRFDNASWPDLIATLERRTEVDLAAWSRVWVGEPGRPEIRTEVEAAEGRITSFSLVQSDPWERGRTWNQRLEWVLGLPDGERRFDVRLDAASVDVDEVRGLPVPEYSLPAGLGYGRFTLGPPTRQYLLAHIADIEDAVLRGIAWLSLWDEMLEGRAAPEALFEAALGWLGGEPEALLVEQVLGDLSELFWRYLPAAARAERSVDLEALLWARLEAAPETSLKASFFRAYVATALSDDAVHRLGQVWRRELEIEDLPLSEEDFIRLALELAVRGAPDAAGVLDAQLERIENPDRRERFAFVMPALSGDPTVREAFFESLRDVRNREQERWALEGLTYLHHPLQAEASRRYVLPSLELLEEIRRTGDIFFPKRWLDVTLGGHGSAEVAEVVRRFLAERPDYPARLRGKVLQSADGLFRAASIQPGSGG